jgi:hypothetical protein
MTACDWSAAMRRTDRAALRRAIAMARSESPARSEQLDAKLKSERWEEVGAFAAFSCQMRALRLKPWEAPADRLRRRGPQPHQIRQSAPGGRATAADDLARHFDLRAGPDRRHGGSRIGEPSKRVPRCGAREFKRTAAPTIEIVSPALSIVFRCSRHPAWPQQRAQARELLRRCWARKRGPRQSQTLIR